MILKRFSGTIFAGLSNHLAHRCKFPSGKSAGNDQLLSRLAAGNRIFSGVVGNDRVLSKLSGDNRFLSRDAGNDRFPSRKAGESRFCSTAATSNGRLSAVAEDHRFLSRPAGESRLFSRGARDGRLVSSIAGENRLSSAAVTSNGRLSAAAVEDYRFLSRKAGENRFCSTAATLNGRFSSAVANHDLFFSRTARENRFCSTAAPASAGGHVATVFGATGFLGRYVVEQLVKLGSKVVVPHRRADDDECKHLKLLGNAGQVLTRKVNVRSDESVTAAMLDSNIVINLIGRDFETHNFSFEELNVAIPERISRLAWHQRGIDRYIHVSALGASAKSPAEQYRTKAAGEEITRTNFPEATILRPAHLVGEEDRLLNRWAGFAKKMPTVPIIGTGSTKFQPAHVTDVAAAVMAVVKDDGTRVGKVFELGGPDVYTINELVALVYEAIREEPRTFHISFPVARLIASATPEEIIKHIPNPTPKLVTFSRNNIDSLRTHYVVSPDALTFKDLGIQPQKLEGAAIEHLNKYRKDAESADATVSL